MTTPRVRELEEELQLAVDERDFLEQSLRRVKHELEAICERAPKVSARFLSLSLAQTLQRIDSDLLAIS